MMMSIAIEKKEATGMDVRRMADWLCKRRQERTADDDACHWSVHERIVSVVRRYAIRFFGSDTAAFSAVGWMLSYAGHDSIDWSQFEEAKNPEWPYPESNFSDQMKGIFYGFMSKEEQERYWGDDI